MATKVIKTQSDYDTALVSIENFMDLDPSLGTPEADELELLTLLVQDFESKQYPQSIPDPINAIQFRMEQQGLTQRDLIPYLGSRSRVSEVLSGKRPLTLSMVRALHSGLGIPASVLLQEEGAALPKESDIDWKNFPLREMIKRRWIVANVKEINERAEELIRQYLKPLGSPSAIAPLYRKTKHVRSARTVDQFALFVWTIQILIRAIEKPPIVDYKPETVDLKFMREVAQLSWSEKGPLLAQEYLWNHGIQLIVEPHLPRTHLDGASIMSNEGRPVIGLTLRHDRVDNFWFVLMHELAHVGKHLSDHSEAFYDDIDTSSENDALEEEADRLAQEALIPEKEWENSHAKKLRGDPDAARHLAKKLKIHPAIVAGRMRQENKNYRVLYQMVGTGKVRCLFKEFIKSFNGD